jgi:peptidoglycan/xylan/chitin deacetylase (PgdA/CDA1 family)
MTEKPFTWPNGARAALSLTFDDARYSQVDIGLPILDRYGVKATFYVSLRPFLERVDEWRAAVANGHEAANHTVRHPCSGNFVWSRKNALEDYTLERMEAEILEANAAIFDAIGTTPTTFAYPCGQRFVGRGEATRSYIPVIARNFLAGRGFPDEHANDPIWCDLAQVGGMRADNTPLEKLRKAIDEALALGHWLILVAHEVGGDAHQTMLAEVLEALCERTTHQNTEIWTDTVTNVAAHIRQARAAHE